MHLLVVREFVNQFTMHGMNNVKARNIHLALIRKFVQHIHSSYALVYSWICCDGYLTDIEFYYAGNASAITRTSGQHDCRQ